MVLMASLVGSVAVFLSLRICDFTMRVLGVSVQCF
jgi:hypothetical protein